MKKIVAVLCMILVFAGAAESAWAAQQIVQVTVPGCFA